MDYHLTGVIRDQKAAQDAQALYWFFRDAEENGTHFTYMQIREHFPRSKSRLSEYVRHYWNWFLRYEQRDRGKTHVFSCSGLKNYTEEDFVLPHPRNQSK